MPRTTKHVLILCVVIASTRWLFYLFLWKHSYMSQKTIHVTSKWNQNEFSIQSKRIQTVEYFVVHYQKVPNSTNISLSSLVLFIFILIFDFIIIFICIFALVWFGGNLFRNGGGWLMKYQSIAWLSRPPVGWLFLLFMEICQNTSTNETKITSRYLRLQTKITLTKNWR